MNFQQAFDRVCNLAAIQGEQCVNSRKKLAFHGTYGKRSFDGLFIGKDEYSRDMEDQYLSSLLAKGLLTHLEPYGKFLDDLGAVHDHSRSVEELREGLIEIAKEYGLDSKSVVAIDRWVVHV